MTIHNSDPKITLTAEQLAEVALSTIRATIGDGKYQYLSGPITGGRRFLDWHCTIGHSLSDANYKQECQAEVVDRNIADILAVAKAERDAGRNTIEPGSFEAKFPQWGQKEFLDFWEKVIKQHAAHVRFMDDWAYSAGCAFEYLCALRCKLEPCDIQGRPLRPESAIQLLDAALTDISSQLNERASRNGAIANLYDKIFARREEIRAQATF